ncbi:MAG: Dabb family protein [Planctomycetaceae bacterium]|nr:Dabb family protein [Planctomycetales bacterium]MCB9923666.1 Dabb family protein [Planctomycetaceae bacterium]
MLGHMVYFTLKDSSDEAIQRLIASCKEHLSGHPGTVLFAAGTRVPDLSREVNDKEFHVALQLVFESRQAQDDYQVHDRHEAFIAANRDNWAKVRVFDAEVS